MNRRSIKLPTTLERTGQSRCRNIGDSVLNESFIMPSDNEQQPFSSSQGAQPPMNPRRKEMQETLVKNNQPVAPSSSVDAKTCDGFNARRQLTLSGPIGSERWRAHRLAEDYIDLVGKLMIPNIRLGTFGYDPASGRYPIERIALLGLLQSPLRRRSVVETWNPLEIATFEAALAVYGKIFHQIQKFIRTKSTKEIIEFYYVWKKTQHYKVWKQNYLSPDELDVDSDDE